ncbi:MAG: cupin domain protein [uncultured archaeon A07HB70]|nr:MAG: cupin domain protein [uncultured archaeon A07HB70]
MESTSVDDLEWTEVDHGTTRFRRMRLASAARDGAPAPDDGVGASLYELPGGARAWPYHYHAGNEEALYVLDGTGLVRGPADETERLAPGDFVLFPTGPEGAHRVVNDGDETLRYLVVSTMRDPDVTTYPDAEAVGVFAGSPPGGDGSARDRDTTGFYPRAERVEFWREVDDA